MTKEIVTGLLSQCLHNTGTGKEYPDDTCYPQRRICPLEASQYLHVTGLKQ